MRRRAGRPRLEEAVLAVPRRVGGIHPRAGAASTGPGMHTMSVDDPMPDILCLECGLKDLLDVDRLERDPPNIICQRCGHEFSPADLAGLRRTI
jgi:hypothetical protein